MPLASGARLSPARSARSASAPASSTRRGRSLPGELPFAPPHGEATRHRVPPVPSFTRPRCDVKAETARWLRDGLSHPLAPCSPPRRSFLPPASPVPPRGGPRPAPGSAASPPSSQRSATAPAMPPRGGYRSLPATGGLQLATPDGDSPPPPPAPPPARPVRTPQPESPRGPAPSGAGPGRGSPQSARSPEQPAYELVSSPSSAASSSRSPPPAAPRPPEPGQQQQQPSAASSGGAEELLELRTTPPVPAPGGLSPPPSPERQAPLPAAPAPREQQALRAPAGSEPLQSSPSTDSESPPAASPTASFLASPQLLQQQQQAATSPTDFSADGLMAQGLRARVEEAEEGRRLLAEQAAELEEALGAALRRLAEYEDASGAGAAAAPSPRQLAEGAALMEADAQAAVEAAVEFHTAELQRALEQTGAQLAAAERHAAEATEQAEWWAAQVAAAGPPRGDERGAERCAPRDGRPSAAPGEPGSPPQRGCARCGALRAALQQLLPAQPRCALLFAADARRNAPLRRALALRAAGPAGAAAPPPPPPAEGAPAAAAGAVGGCSPSRRPAPAMPATAASAPARAAAAEAPGLAGVYAAAAGAAAAPPAPPQPALSSLAVQPAGCGAVPQGEGGAAEQAAQEDCSSLLQQAAVLRLAVEAVGAAAASRAAAEAAARRAEGRMRGLTQRLQADGTWLGCLDALSEHLGRRPSPNTAAQGNSPAPDCAAARRGSAAPSSGTHPRRDSVPTLQLRRLSAPKRTWRGGGIARQLWPPSPPARPAARRSKAAPRARAPAPAETPRQEGTLGQRPLRLAPPAAETQGGAGADRAPPAPAETPQTQGAVTPAPLPAPPEPSPQRQGAEGHSPQPSRSTADASCPSPVSAAAGYFARDGSACAVLRAGAGREPLRGLRGPHGVAIFSPPLHMPCQQPPRGPQHPAAAPTR
eukprot:TRINITY_DN5802_c1_g2_i3.p1 TRINITY_DN5802_c1_g2~~TRINITY_DN5802_c1_g2_i3.p1  ORF type:complete len:934 (+),score=202.59 TRINITY_DN5802_c1_g2_i3:84-2885(+)